MVNRRVLFRLQIVPLFLAVADAATASSSLIKESKLTPDNGYNHYSKRSAFCPSSTQCIPLSSCPLLSDVISNECALTSRIGSLGCGYQGSGLVCCPQTSESSIINPGKMVDGQRCGLSQIQGENYDGIGAFPWVARVGFRNILSGEVKFPCTGSIINNRIILTAAHCALAKADNFKLFLVRIGEWNSNTEIDCGEEFCGLPVQDIAISHVVVHPGYEKQTYRHNIALLVLRSKINYTETPSRQQSLFLPIINLQQCVRVYGKTLPITEEQLCAGGEQGNDACSGFGGAPLLVKHGETYYQVGILSFGSDQCGAAGVPSVYTSVKKYATWIQENTPQVYNN